MQSRVRRLIGRRRGGGGGGGLERFIGGALRDPSGSQDSVLVDPISELLAQLSSAGEECVGGWEGWGLGGEECVGGWEGWDWEVRSVWVVGRGGDWEVRSVG